MENNTEFRAKYANMTISEFMELPNEELMEISKVRYKTGQYKGSPHYLALRAMDILRNRKYWEQRKPGEIKIIVPANESADKANAAAEKLSGVALRPELSRKDMIRTLKKEYSDTYLARIVNHQHEQPQKQDCDRVISYLRKLFPSTYDFREAKKLLAIDSMDRLEVCYTAYFLSNLWQEKCNERKEQWKQSILDEYGSWQEYFKACGWIEHKGSYYKPEQVKKTADPDVLKPFHVVSYRLEKRKGYRGKKSEFKEKAVLAEKSTDISFQ